MTLTDAGRSVPIVVVCATRSAPLSAATDRIAAISWLGWDEIADRLDAPMPAALLLLDAQGVADDVLADTLHRIDALAGERGLPIVAALSETQIDIVSAGLVGRDVTLLCTPGEAEWIAAIALATIASDGTSATGVREGDTERLVRLREELARIVEALVRLSRGDQTDGVPGAVADARPGFVGRPATAEIAADDVRRMIRARRLRDRFFGDGIFEDPAWDMLLDLFAARLEQARVSVSSLCIAAAVAPTTALRWIAKLTEADLLVRQPDPLDRRRAFVALSPRATDAMHRYVLAVRDAGLPLA